MGFGGNMKPVTLVRIVVVRNTPVQPDNRRPLTKPPMTTKPVAMATRLITT